MVSVARQGRSDNYRLIVAGYPEKVPSGELDWWKVGTACYVQVGRNEDAGKMLIAKAKTNAPFQLERVGSHPNSPCGLRLSLPSHLPKEPRNRQAVKYKLAPEEIMIELPTWTSSGDLWVGAQLMRAV
jgi:hypothetical protein